MGHEVIYESVTNPTWSVFLDTIRQGTAVWTHRAALGDVGVSNFLLEDSTGTAGHLSDAIVGHKTIRVNETTEAAGNRNIWTGFVADRRYVRGVDTALLTGAAREINVTCYDINASAGFEIFHGGAGDRPAETVTARITWLLGSGYLDAVDNGFVVASSEALDANNYDGQYPADVLADCALKAAYNWFLYWDPSAGQISLWFANSNTSTLYTSSLKISNVLSDVDSTQEGIGATETFAPSRDGELTRDPKHIYSGVYLPYAGGAVFGTNAATQSAFAVRHGPAPTASVKTAAAANALLTKLLDAASTEADGITCTIIVPAVAVNDIRAGQRLQVKFSHLPGYESYRWCRVLTKTVRQDERPDIYHIELVLSPQCTFGNATRVRRTVDQTMPANSSTPIAWQEATYGGSPIWTVGDPTKLSIPAAGRWRIGGNYRLKFPITGLPPYVILRVNGTTDIAVHSTHVFVDQFFVDTIETVHNFNAGDYVEMIIVNQSASDTISVYVAGQYAPSMWIHAESGVGARIYRATNQSIPELINTKVSFSNVRYDDASFWSGGSPTRLTIPSTGDYRLTANIKLTPGGDLGYPALQVGFWRNGTEFIGVRRNDQGDPTISCAVAEWRFTAGDYVEIDVLMEGSANLDIVAVAQYGIEATIQKISESATRIRRTSTVATTSGVNLTVSWQSERYDDANLWTSGSNLTIPATGLYHVVTTTAFEGNSNGSRNVFYRVNGTDFAVYGRETTSSPGGAQGTITASTDWLFNGGDVLTIVVEQDSGSTLNLDANSAYGAEISVSTVTEPGICQ